MPARAARAARAAARRARGRPGRTRCARAASRPAPGHGIARAMSCARTGARRRWGGGGASGDRVLGTLAAYRAAVDWVDGERASSRTYAAVGGAFPGRAVGLERPLQAQGPDELGVGVGEVARDIDADVVLAGGEAEAAIRLEMLPG